MGDTAAVTLIEDHENSLSFSMDLPAGIPLSAMAENFHDRMQVVANDDKEAIRDIVFQSLGEFYSKYIDSKEAPLEVNIAWKTRRNISYIFDGTQKEENVQDTLTLIESAVQEIAQLMKDANIRFQASRRVLC